MIQEFVHCKKCVAKLEKYGKLPLDYYLGICEFYAQKKPIICEGGKNGRTHPIIYFLENKKYVVTTEFSKNNVIIKPLGYREYDKEFGAKTHEFCAFRNDH